MTGTGLTVGRLDAATAELVAGSLREILAAPDGGRGLAAALDELGWDEVLADDPAAATTLLFTEHGRALATSRALDDVLLAELAASLPEATGRRALLYPLDPLDPHLLDGGQPAGPRGPLTGLLLGPLDGIAEVVGADGAGADGVRTDGAGTDGVGAAAGVTLRILPADRLAAVARPVAGFDHGSGWLVVEAGQTATAGPATPPATPPATRLATPAADAWARAVAAGQRALAAEIVGVCEAALALAVAHTSSRVQYGKPIATFQAVRHRLAEAHVAIESTRSSLTAAWAAQSAPDGGAWAARLAKLRAGSAQATVMRHAVQVCGAIGLSWEHELHRHVTRAAALDALLGGHRALTEQIGAELLAGADLDPVVEI